MCRGSLLLFLLLTCFLQSQPPLKTEWNKSVDFEVGEHDIGIQSFEINEKVFLLGTLYNYTHNSWGVINSLWDTTGQVVTKRTFFDSSYYSLEVKKGVSVGNRVVYGIGTAKKHNDTIHDFDLYFVKYDALGDTVFTKIFNDTGSVIGFDIICQNPNLFVVLGQARKDQNNPATQKTVLMVLDSTGKILKQNSMAAGDYMAYYIRHDPIKHEYYALGSKQKSSFLQAFDDSTLKFKYLVNHLAGQIGYLQSVVLQEGVFYCIFSVEAWSPPVPFPGNQLKISKFILSNGIALRKDYIIPPTDTTGNAGATNLVVDEGQVIFAGYNTYTGLDMYFCDTTLRELCRAGIEGPETASPLWHVSTTLTQSKKLISTGFSADMSVPGNSQIITWLSMSMNYQRFIEDNCITGSLENNEQVNAWRIFPNPCVEHLLISSGNINNGTHATVRILNMLGQVCLRQDIDLTEDNSIDVRYLSAGLYTLLITSGQQSWSRKLVKNGR